MNKVINIPIFGQALLVMFGSKDSAIEAMIENVPSITRDDAESFFPNSYCRGMFNYSTKYDAYALWMPIVPNTVSEYSTLVHEIQHFVFTMLDNLGVKHSTDSDEVYSYVFAFVFEEIDTFLSENRYESK